MESDVFSALNEISLSEVRHTDGHVKSDLGLFRTPHSTAGMSVVDMGPGRAARCITRNSGRKKKEKKNYILNYVDTQC